MAQRASDHWISIGLSVLLHGALLAALVYGWLIFRQPRRPPPPPAIEATVVDARTLAGAQPKAPEPAAAPQPAPAPPPEEVGPPPPTPEQRVQREQEEQQQRQVQEQKAAEERAASERAAADKAAEEKAAEKAAAKKAAADKAAAAKAKAAADKAAAAQRAADEQDRREREEDLKRSLAAEAHADAARDGAARASWVSMIQARITRAWLRPPTARAGIDCVLNVTQVPGGEVTQVTVGACNGDQAVRDSIEAAVYRASPLPPPPAPSLFDRNLEIRFKPD